MDDAALPQDRPPDESAHPTTRVSRKQEFDLRFKKIKVAGQARMSDVRPRARSKVPAPDGLRFSCAAPTTITPLPLSGRYYFAVPRRFRALSGVCATGAVVLRGPKIRPARRKTNRLFFLLCLPCRAINYQDPRGRKKNRHSSRQKVRLLTTLRPLCIRTTPEPGDGA